jgi:hypothetical protein
VGSYFFWEKPGEKPGGTFLFPGEYGKIEACWADSACKGPGFPGFLFHKTRMYGNKAKRIVPHGRASNPGGTGKDLLQNVPADSVRSAREMARPVAGHEQCITQQKPR